MFSRIVFALLLNIFLLSENLNVHSWEPFILNTFLDYCVLNSTKDNFSMTVTSKLWEIEYNNLVLYYTLCGYVPEKLNCGVNVTACIRYKFDDSFEVLGEKNVLVDKNTLSIENTNSRFCKHNQMKKYKLQVKFSCSEDMQEQQLDVHDDCEYVIHRLSPDCYPKCTTKISELLVDLRPLTGNFAVHSDGKNFSITLCGSNHQCENTEISGVSSCEITNNEITALSKFDSEMLLYNQAKNELIFHGSYKGQKKRDEKRFELLMKCDWYNNGNEITYKIAHPQGKHYKFEMKSKYGCIKLPSHCLITDAFFIYNLTGLYDSRGYIEVSNVPKGRMYLNICGPLHLHSKENACSRSFSQVCELNGEIYINRGSIPSDFEIVDDVITATVTNGVTCVEDSSMEYTTHINFYCSKTKEDPKFISFDKCETWINWNTPLACPIYDKASCKYIHTNSPHPKDCLVKLQGYYYDLNPLTLNNGRYEVEDSINSSIKYFLNVCGPVTDSDVPCMKDSMVLMEDSGQANLKYRFKSLGKMNTIYTDDKKQVVIQTLSGSYCGTEGDYTSTVYFICSDKEEKPRLVSRTQCSFQFQWKTPHACPKKESATEDTCVLQDLENNISLNFAKMKQTSIWIVINKTYETYVDICKNNYIECLHGKEHCKDLPIGKKLVTHDATYLEFDLLKDCDKTDFNKVVFELVCDVIESNEYFKLIGLNNCTVVMELHTNLICTIEDVPKNVKYHVGQEEEKENCSVTNHNTGYKFYISSLKLDIRDLDCPKVIFNSRNSSVMLIYTNPNKSCEEANGYGVYIYKVLLQCSKEELNHTQQTECSQIYKFEKPEFCQLLATSILDSHLTANSSTPIGVIIGSVVGALAVIAICVLCVLRKGRPFLRLPLYNGIYEKDCDL